MAAGTWNFYVTAKRYLMTGDIDLNISTIRMALFTSASNAFSSLNLSVYGSVTGQVSNNFGYLTSGKALVYTWGTGASANEQRFNASPVVWSAVGGDIANVKYAVLFVGDPTAANRKLLCWCPLSTGQFPVTSGNVLTVTPSANGIFELN